MKKEVFLYTDGACRGNPGPGGWGAVVRFGRHEKTVHGGEIDTTNNRMELLAVIRALETLKESCRVLITTDSKYVLQGVMEWMVTWKKNGWKTAAKKPVKNQDLWQALDAALLPHDVQWRWVKGHSGHPENERADQLANRGIDEISRPRSTGE